MPYVGFAFTERALHSLEGLPPKVRKQVAKRAKNLLLEPHPPSSKRLVNVETDEGDPVYRERSGDYSILYIVCTQPDEVLILDIGHRKEVYRMTKTKSESASDKGMKQSDFDEIMAKALGIPPPENDDAKRLTSYPRKNQG